jgi:hypothetical protein
MALLFYHISKLFISAAFLIIIPWFSDYCYSMIGQSLWTNWVPSRTEEHVAFMGFHESNSKEIVSKTVDSLRGVAVKARFDEGDRESEAPGCRCGGQHLSDLAAFDCGPRIDFSW